MPKQTQSKIKAIVTHPDIPASLEWDTIDGGGWTHNSSKARASAGGRKEVIEGESERENFKTTTLVDTSTHMAFLKLCHDGYKFPNATVARQIVDSAGVPVGDPLAATGCWAEQVTMPQGDANGSDLVKVEIEWMTP